MNLEKARTRIKFAEHLRRNRTKSERKFAAMLTELGMEFMEQEPVGKYIADFLFPRHGNRIVELDGVIHREMRERDQLRDGYLRQLGYKVFRVPSCDVFIQPKWLMHRVLTFLNEPHERPSRKARKRRTSLNKLYRKAQRKPTKLKMVERLTKDHLPIKKKRPPKPLNEMIEVTPQANKTIRVIKGNGGTL
jgi:very-short-patch-repair endonuclease